LAAVAGRPARLPVPGFALRLALGELGAALVPGQRIAPRAALAGGYVFSHPELAPALEDLLA
jgi:NAD dependent epimerase/dehydratase family enzyme